MRVLIFSGDTDGVIPTAGTRQWIKSLGWTKTIKERPWYVNDQVAGYIEIYDGLDFTTVHGGGHIVP